MSDKKSQGWMDVESMPDQEDDGKLACISGLPIARKQKAWAEINQNSPGLAQLLRDPLLHQIVEMFEAEIFVEAELVPSLPTTRLKGRLS